MYFPQRSGIHVAGNAMIVAVHGIVFAAAPTNGFERTELQERARGMP